MNNGKSIMLLAVSVAVAVVVGATMHHTRTPTSTAWYRVADGIGLEPIDSGLYYMYYPHTMAGTVEKVEPTPDDLVSDERQTEIYYRADSNGNLCHTYVLWDTDLEPGDHMVLSVICKYRTDMDVTDGFEPTTLVGREVIDFQVTKQ